MEDQVADQKQELRALTADIVSAYVNNNSTPLASLSDIIASVHSALKTLGAPAPQPVAERRTPPVSIKKSITDEYLISLEDGRQYKSLRRHLGGRGLTPEQYREKWGLPRDYPMAAPSYARQRSELAKSLGLGQSRQKAREAAEAASAAKPKRGRKAPKSSAEPTSGA